MSEIRVVVTGLGAVTGLGVGVDALWQGLCVGRSAVRPWRLPGYDDFPVRYAAPVDDDALREACMDRSWWRQPMERRTRFGIAAAEEAIRDSGIRTDSSQSTRIGVAVGSGVPERDADDMRLAIRENEAEWVHLYDNREQLNRNTGLFHSNDHLAAMCAIATGARGPVLHFSTACSGAAHAIGHGFRMIRRGEVDVMLVGGADSVLNLCTMLGLHMLGAPSISERFGTALSRPFDRDRSGFIASEGAGMLVLESQASATRRGAQVYAEIAGFGSALDAYQITAPHPEGHGAALAMERALGDARMAPEDIDHINAHGTSTPLNDPAETLAIKRVFARAEHYRRLSVSANKSMLGHLIAAAAGPECIATVLSLRYGKVPPTLNLEAPDPLCDLDYVPGKIARMQSLRAALSNSFGFGGLNTAIAFKAVEQSV
jgi:3-oxoacyl-[acyl-carrier-protein] synthase II